MLRRPVPPLTRNLLLTLANTVPALVATMVGSWFLAASAFALAEPDVGLVDGMYWSVVTMTTTGYGDLSPATAAGKITAIVMMLWSVFFLLPAAVAHIVTRLIQDRNLFSHEEQEQLKAAVDEIHAWMAEQRGREIPDT
jgi:voltage-gated potassium channel